MEYIEQKTHETNNDLILKLRVFKVILHQF